MSFSESQDIHIDALQTVNFKPFFQPVNLLHEASCAGEIEQHTVPAAGVETNAVVQLSQIYGTQVKRASIAFIQVIRSIHHAVKKDAVVDSKHVSGFVGQNLATPPQYERIAIRSVDSIKFRVITRKAKHSNAVVQRSFTENKVP
jgi:hypothetical protein